jgi:hypothetical protein
MARFYVIRDDVLAGSRSFDSIEEAHAEAVKKIENDLQPRLLVQAVCGLSVDPKPHIVLNGGRDEQ